MKQVETVIRSIFLISTLFAIATITMIAKNAAHISPKLLRVALIISIILWLATGIVDVVLYVMRRARKGR